MDTRSDIELRYRGFFHILIFLIPGFFISFTSYFRLYFAIIVFFFSFNCSET